MTSTPESEFNEEAFINMKDESLRPPKDANGEYTIVDMSLEELERLNLKTKSAVIRLLRSRKYSRSAVAKFLNVKYQHVRNVDTQYLKRGPRE